MKMINIIWDALRKIAFFVCAGLLLYYVSIDNPTNAEVIDSIFYSTCIILHILLNNKK